MGITSATRSGCLVVILAVFGIIVLAAVWITHNEQPANPPATSSAPTAPAEPPAAIIEYTPAQLREMVAAGLYPDQGEPESTTRKMRFGDCVSTAQSLIKSVAPEYPAQVVVDTSLVYLAKAWTNDGSVVITCSSLDESLVVVRSPYV